MTSPTHGVRPASRWAIVRGASETWDEFRRSCQSQPTGTMWRWMLRLAIGWVLCAMLMWLLTLLARWLAGRGMQQWDERTLLAIERGPMGFTDAIMAESPGNLTYLIPLTLAGAVVAARLRRPMLALSFIASYVLARPLVIIGWQLWNRPRPQLIEGGVASLSLHSFPSGHVALGISVFGLLAYVWARRSRSLVERLLIWALLVAWVAMAGIARVRLGAHWPSDLIGGAIVGFAWLGVVAYALRKAEWRPE